MGAKTKVLHLSFCSVYIFKHIQECSVWHRFCQGQRPNIKFISYYLTIECCDWPFTSKYCMQLRNKKIIISIPTHSITLTITCFCHTNHSLHPSSRHSLAAFTGIFLTFSWHSFASQQPWLQMWLFVFLSNSWDATAPWDLCYLFSFLRPVSDFIVFYLYVHRKAAGSFTWFTFLQLLRSQTNCKELLETSFHCWRFAQLQNFWKVYCDAH